MGRGRKDIIIRAAANTSGGSLSGTHWCQSEGRPGQNLLHTQVALTGRPWLENSNLGMCTYRTAATTGIKIPLDTEPGRETNSKQLCTFSE